MLSVYRTNESIMDTQSLGRQVPHNQVHLRQKEDHDVALEHCDQSEAQVNGAVTPQSAGHRTYGVYHMQVRSTLRVEPIPPCGKDKRFGEGECDRFPNIFAPYSGIRPMRSKIHRVLCLTWALLTAVTFYSTGNSPISRVIKKCV